MGCGEALARWRHRHALGRGLGIVSMPGVGQSIKFHTIHRRPAVCRRPVDPRLPTAAIQHGPPRDTAAAVLVGPPGT